MGAHDGYFPEGTMLRWVQAHRAVGQTYGQRALLIGATHPVPYVGTSQATLARERPFERLARTAVAFETVFFGSRVEADRVLLGVRHMHERVKGTLPRDEGTFPAGTPYDAVDPELMLWTMAMLADSSRVAFETMVRPLTPAEKDELWADWVLFGVLFGMPEEVAPPTAAAFERWMADWYSSGRMHLTEEARAVGRGLASAMPVPLVMAPGVRLMNVCVTGMLPPEVRALFGLRWSPAHEALFRATTLAVRRSHVVVPDRVRLGDNRDLHETVIRKERSVVDRGGRLMDLPEPSSS